jgi:diacylglycerol O-acyltransferase / wax synthase
VKQIRRDHGGTVNDVLLASITSGFRGLLAARGELTDGLVVRTAVPVSIRIASEHGELTNRISATLVNLPVAEPDPVRRLELLRSQTADLKRTRQGVGPEVLTKVLGIVPPAVLAAGCRAGFTAAQPLVQAITTNVPGPLFPLVMLGRRMAAAYPYVPIGGNVRVGVAMFSYRHQLTLGITADHEAMPDVHVLTEGIYSGIGELLPAA